MAGRRYLGTATRLAEGRVLVAGGVDLDTRTDLTVAEVYNPATGTFTATGSMSVGRVGPTATLLADGRVLSVDVYRHN